jgi:hypothetical protein
VAILEYAAQERVMAQYLYEHAGVPTDGTNGTYAHIALPGALLIDTDAKTLYQNTNTQASPVWTERSVPAWLMSGEGSPVDSVTPVQQGAVYQDLTNGGLYLALGATDADWVAYGGVAGNVGEATGLIFNGANHDVYLLAGSRDEAAAFLYIGSAWEQWNGPGNGLTFLYGQDEGNPSLAVQIKTGIAGEFVGTLQDVDGRMIVPGLLRAEHGVLLATSDPHIAGALWNNGGTPAISAG